MTISYTYSSISDSSGNTSTYTFKTKDFIPGWSGIAALTHSKNSIEHTCGIFDCFAYYMIEIAGD
ncbi:MAG: hypothetical protein KAR32_04250, partial [Candidatus Omnitrophica bacterium]|nr:hypothetical protein [Candidatus Omnitrophota bacterium]